MKYIIRQEKQDEYFEVESLIREAFWNVYMPGAEEHLLANKLRNDSNYLSSLSRIVIYDNRIVAAIMCAKATLLDKNNKTHEILTFGPLAVLPEYQKMGFGSILVNEVIKLARLNNYEAIVITGVPTYYPRFGFKSCDSLNLFIEGDIQFPALLGLELAKDYFKSLGKCYFIEPHIYTSRASKIELDEFDKSFPFLNKEIKPTQWKEMNK